MSGRARATSTSWMLGGQANLRESAQREPGPPGGSGTGACPGRRLGRLGQLQVTLTLDPSAVRSTGAECDNG